MNTNCMNCDIKQVTVLNTTHTELWFECAPGLQDGDVLTLGDNIVCDPSVDEGPNNCVEEQLASLKGTYSFADRATNTPVAPDTYIVGNTIRATSSNQKYVIEIGWPSPTPRFAVLSDSNNNYKRGRWVRHSHAQTREELLGTVQKFD